MIYQQSYSFCQQPHSLVLIIVGKTLQTISLLAYLREGRGVKGPHIVIVPKSVVGNWIKEFGKWCPSIKAVRMGGTKEERKKASTTYLKPNEDGKYGFDALVCSYEAVLKEKSALAKIPWRYLIIDEAHRIKNENSSLSKAVRLLNTGFRLLITGTPLQVSLVLGSICMSSQNLLLFIPIILSR